MKVKLIFKIVTITIVWSLYFAFMQGFQPLLATNVAVEQMNDSAISFINYQLYQRVIDVAWIVPAIITILLILSNIKSVLKKLKKQFNQI